MARRGRRSGGNLYDPTPVPNLYAVMPVIDNMLWAGIGVGAPYGLASDYGDDWFGRFDLIETELEVINIAPSLAFKATEWLSIGGGIDIQYADAKLTSAVSDTVAEGQSSLKGDDWSAGYNIGVLIKPMETTEIGLHYRSAISHELDGNIEVSGLSGLVPTAPNFATGGTADLDLPDLATFGIAHQLTPELRLMGQATWFGWNNFQAITAVSDAGTELSSVTQNYWDHSGPLPSARNMTSTKHGACARRIPVRPDTDHGRIPYVQNTGRRPHLVQRRVTYHMTPQDRP